MQNDIGLYIHWPFCVSKCPYCDFNSHVAHNIIDHDLWLDSYLKELEYFLQILENKKIKTIFFGGGTPSLMKPSIPEGIINWLYKKGLLSSIEEITLEANPTSVEASLLQSFKDIGINRVSLGIQSLNNERLKQLGRTHDSLEAIKAIETARNIFERFSFDLIYATENQTLTEWKSELQEAMTFAPDHMSLYQLTIEKGTKFYKLHQANDLILPDNDIASDMYLYTVDFMQQKGYNQYEISNFAKPAQECKHNLIYWHYGEYLGIGPGAHSRLCFHNKKPSAMMTYHQPQKWLNLTQECGSAIQSSVQLTDTEILEEILMMGLRLNSGISDDKIKKYFGKSFSDILNMSEVQKLIDGGFISFDTQAPNLKLTLTGLMMHNYIVPRIL
jgi:putative oxygen-independent coproporphyrinogen III oxidase